MKKKKIAIIGAGILGSSCAYYLSKNSDFEVFLIDRYSVGSGAASWAASLLTQVRKDLATMALVQETYRTIEQLSKELGNPLGERRIGSLQVVSSDTSYASIKALENVGNEFKLNKQWISPDAVKQKLPWMDTSKVKDSLFYPDDMFLDAHVLAYAYAQVAKQRGATIIQYKDVKEIEVKDNKVKQIIFENDERLVVDVVVDAAGAWSNILSIPHGIQLPYSPVRSLYWITKTDERLFPANQPMTVIPDAMVYTKPETGALLFGIRDKASKAFDPRELPKDLNGFEYISAEEQQNILLDEGKLFMEFFPELEETGIAHYEAGFSTYTADSKFILGKSERINDFYFATGCEGTGVAISGGFGRIIAELISDKTPFLNIEAYHPERFGSFNLYTTDFLQKCSDSRSNKRDGV